MTAKRRILYPRLTQSQTRRTLSRNQAVHLRIKLLYSAMLSQLCQYMGVIRRSRRDESRRPNWLAQPIDYIGHLWDDRIGERTGRRGLDRHAYQSI